MSTEDVTVADIAQRSPGLRAVLGSPEQIVRGITNVSADVMPGWMFACVPGSLVDGHQFATDAHDRGAVALLAERSVGADLPCILVDDVRVALGHASAAVYGDASRELTVVGVTGTNGKTTTTWLLSSVLNAVGRSCTMLGTLSGSFTTPEAPLLQRVLRAAVTRNESAVAMEVSSHALALNRVDATWFEVGVFTNLTQDHLDLHGSIDTYFAVKSRLFEPGRCGVGVINTADEYGRRLIEACEIDTVGYSPADAVDVDFDAQSSRFRWRGRRVHIGMGGHFSVTNAVAAATAASACGVGDDEIVEALAVAPPVPGRFEPVDAGQPYAVIVDYAHTPDGLANALRAARRVTSERLIVVFGCGGDRDRTKRSIMGSVASDLADVVVITSDNPRSESPAAIIGDVLSGIAEHRRGAVVTEPDRRAAIALAVGSARAGDVIVVAGKGHESTQTIGRDVQPFDDRVVARELIEATAR